MTKKSASYGKTLRKAADIADQRQKEYGDYKDNFQNVSDICHTTFGLDLSAEDVIKVMVAVKLSRDRFKPGKDNRIDATNYQAMLADML